MLKVSWVLPLLPFLTFSEFLWRGREENYFIILYVITKSSYVTLDLVCIFACLPVCQWCCVCSGDFVIVDYIINCLLGSLKVHWVTARLQAGQLKRCWECCSLSHAWLATVCVHSNKHMHRVLCLCSLLRREHDLFIALYASGINLDISPTYLIVLLIYN